MPILAILGINQPLEKYALTLSQLKESNFGYADATVFVPLKIAELRIKEAWASQEAVVVENERLGRTKEALSCRVERLEAELKKFKPYTPEAKPVIVPDLDAIALQYANHLEREAKRVRETVEQRKQKAQKQAEVEAAIAKQAEAMQPHYVNTTKPHGCEKCGAVIPKGKVWVVPDKTGDGTRSCSRYYCQKCGGPTNER